MSDSADFVGRFAEAWAEPTPERLLALLHPDVRLVAPLMATTVGHEEARREFSRLLELVPDVHGTVERWAGEGELVFIEFVLAGTLGRRPIDWRLVDRFRLEGGLGIERISYFDPLPLMVAIARTPSAWGRLWRSGLGPPLKRRRFVDRKRPAT